MYKYNSLAQRDLWSSKLIAKVYRTLYIKAFHKNKLKQNCRHNNINEVKTVPTRYRFSRVYNTIQEYEIEEN